MTEQQRTTEEQLKPCPFCGEPASIGGDREHGFCVVCDGLHCYTAIGEAYDKYGENHHIFSSESEAVEAWNRRVTP